MAALEFRQVYHNVRTSLYLPVLVFRIYGVSGKYLEYIVNNQ